MVSLARFGVSDVADRHGCPGGGPGGRDALAVEVGRDASVGEAALAELPDQLDDGRRGHDLHCKDFWPRHGAGGDPDTGSGA